MNQIKHRLATARATRVLSLALAAIALAYAAPSMAAEQTYGQPLVCAPGEDKALLVFQVSEYRNGSTFDRVRCGPHGWFRSEKGLSSELEYFERTKDLSVPNGAQIISVIPLDQ